MHKTAAFDLSGFWQSLARTDYELKWFLIGVGQVGILHQTGNPSQTLELARNMRRDINGFETNAAELVGYMKAMLDNIEHEITSEGAAA